MLRVPARDPKHFLMEAGEVFKKNEAVRREKGSQRRKKVRDAMQKKAEKDRAGKKNLADLCPGRPEKGVRGEKRWGCIAHADEWDCGSLRWITQDE